MGESTCKNSICFVMSSLNVGGTEKQFLQFIAAEREVLKTYRITLITLLPTTIDLTAIKELFDDIGIRTVLVQRSNQSFPRFFMELVKTMRAARPNLVHTVLDGSTGIWGRLAAWLCGVRLIFHSSRDRNAPLTRAQRLLRPFLNRVTIRFLPNAQALADDLVEMGVPRRKIVVMPNGVDLERFNPVTVTPLRCQWRLPEEARIVGFLGRFSEQKRLDLLLDALLILPEDERPDYVVLGGDGPTMPAVRARCEANAWLKERCLLLGMVEQTPGFMAGIDYLVLCSDHEGTPNVVLEAMAMERPIVATRVSNVPALIEGVGFLADVGRAESLAHALRQMQQLSPEERAAMGKEARARVAEKYNLKHSAELFWKTHFEVLLTGAPS